MELKAFEVAKLINGVIEGDSNSTINKLSKIENGDNNVTVDHKFNIGENLNGKHGIKT